MNPGYVIISLASLIKLEDVSLCLPASPRTPRDADRERRKAPGRVLTSLYSAAEKHSCIKLDLTEVGHIPRGASDIAGGTSKKLKGLERKLLEGRIVFAGEPGFTRGFPPGSKGPGSMPSVWSLCPWKSEQEQTGLKEGGEVTALSQGTGHQWELPGRVDKDEI